MKNATEKPQIEISAFQEIARHKELKNVDGKFCFYYDESNNIRKLYLDETRPNILNVPMLQSFVIAGIMLDDQNTPNIKALRNNLRLQATTNEIKLKHLVKGDFLNLISQHKIEVFLNWMADNNAYVHYSHIDPLYWSIVDIIESISSKLDNPLYYQMDRLLKNALYQIIKHDPQTFLGTLEHFNYPSIELTEISNFTTWLLSFIDANISIVDHVSGQILKSFITEALRLNELPFIMNNDAHVLIDGFYIFYLERICTFKNSSHYIDSEAVVEEKLESLDLLDSGKTLKNYQFIDSKTEPMIQVSDILAGILGKYFTFIAQTPAKELLLIKNDLTKIQQDNLSKLKKLIDKSDKFSQGLFHTIACDNDIAKHNFFLHSSN